MGDRTRFAPATGRQRSQACIRRANVSSKLVVALALLLFAVPLPLADSSFASSGTTFSNDTTSYARFLPAVYAGNLKWYANQPTGQYCEDWNANCQQITHAYYAFFHAKKGQTPGKRIMELQVKTVEGKTPLGWKKAVVRQIAYILSSLVLIGPILIAVDEKKQGLHDMLAGTTVVKEKVPGSLKKTLLKFLLAAMAAGALIGAATGVLA
jgi:hypothetical protein